MPNPQGKGAFPAEPQGSLALRELSAPSFGGGDTERSAGEPPRLGVMPGAETGVIPHPTELPPLREKNK